MVSPIYTSCNKGTSIGSGSNALVFKGKGVANGVASSEDIAIKEVRNDGGQDMENEVAALRKLHENPEGSTYIVKYYGRNSSMPKQIYLELIEGKTLEWALSERYLRNDDDFKLRKSILLQLAKAIEYMATQNVSNIDFNKQNIMLQSGILSRIDTSDIMSTFTPPAKADLDLTIKVKLIDFGKASISERQGILPLITLFYEMFQRDELSTMVQGNIKNFKDACEKRTLTVTEAKTWLV
ncbi:hypothetical protein BGX34_005810 [Mortierella sp. NVP85]|nr:hypothetical protein BGX34_005810 [Mortierella sp. NVP85]